MVDQKQIERLNKQMRIGFLPDELNFSSTQVPNEFDIDKIKYNSFYKSCEFFEKKFPNGCYSIPGFDAIIQNMADNAKTPLEEITEKQKVACESCKA